MTRNKAIALTRAQGVHCAATALLFHNVATMGCMVAFEYVSAPTTEHPTGKRSTVRGIPTHGTIGEHSTQSVRVESVDPARPGVRAYNLLRMSDVRVG